MLRYPNLFDELAKVSRYILCRHRSFMSHRDQPIKYRQGPGVLACAHMHGPLNVKRI